MSIHHSPFRALVGARFGGVRGVAARLVVALVFASTFAPLAANAVVRAQLETPTVRSGEALTLTIVREGRQSADRPDLAPLNKDFEVQGMSTSTEISFVNGARSDRTRWSVRLLPRHDGTIEVPVINVGDEQTEAQSLAVSDAPAQNAEQSAPHVILEADSPPVAKSIYVQQQIPYTVKLYYDDTLRNGQLSAPDPTDAMVEPLGEEKRYTATHDGRAYNVIERRYAISPEKSGTLHVSGAAFQGTAIVSSGSRTGGDSADAMMERLLRNTPFANDPFFRNRMRGQAGFADIEQPVNARARDIAIAVQPRPPAAQGNWLPAQQVTLHDSWEDRSPQFKVGEPVTRTITVEVKGLAASQVPALSFGAPANVRLYSETTDSKSRVDGDTIVGLSRQRMTYIANGEHALTIPAVSLPWWNVVADKAEVATLPAREVSVAPGVVSAQPSAAASGKNTTAIEPVAPAGPTRAVGVANETPLAQTIQDYWKWLAGGALALFALALTAIVTHRIRSGPHAREAGGDHNARRQAAMTALRRACEANDAHAARRALLDVARNAWPTDPPRGLAELAARIDGQRARSNILALDRSLYASDKSPWQGEGLWSAARAGLRTVPVAAPQDDDLLEPLYR